MPIPSRQVDPVDAVGAGNCLDGALLARLGADDYLLSAARYANAAAALAISGFGAVAPLPQREPLAAFLSLTLD